MVISDGQFVEGNINFKTFLEFTKKAREGIEIVTPWIIGDGINKILKSRNGPIKTKITVRWPDEFDTPELYDIELLETIKKYENVELKYIGKPNTLHAKVYFVDSIGAIVTSANLTDMGFPRKNKNGNVELGVVIKNSTTLNKLSNWLENLNSDNMENSDIKKLADWKKAYSTWEKENVKGIRPHPPKPPYKSNIVVQNALEFAKKNKVIRDYDHISNGMGRKAYSFNLNNKREKYSIRAITSIENKDASKEFKRNFHFDIPRHDVNSWKQNMKNSIKGLVLIPLQSNEDEKYFDSSNDAPISYIPFSFLFSRKNMRISDITMKRKTKPPTIFLSKTNEDDWVLRGSSFYSKQLHLNSCIGNAQKLKSYPIRYVK